jgi:hypothetical protein
VTEALTGRIGRMRAESTVGDETEEWCGSD